MATTSNDAQTALRDQTQRRPNDGSERPLWGSRQTVVELLRMPEADGVDLDFEPIRIDAKELDA